ncbi:MAG: dienelactone hydrolase family protein [Ilumatobacteraceae bacterium]
MTTSNVTSTVTSTDVEYSIDGRRHVGYLAVPDGDGVGPGVLVCHEGPGLDAHAKMRADKIAGELGFVTFALDYHGDGTPLPMAEVMPKLGALMGSPDATRALGQAGLDQLLAHPRVDPAKIAAIGYCFGGTMALELARGGVDLAAVVGFHSGLGTAGPAAAGAVKAKILVLIGVDDPIIPPEQRTAFEAEMNAAGADWQMHLYGGAAHSFTNAAADGSMMAGIKYHAPTDARSWRAMVDMFEEVF